MAQFKYPVPKVGALWALQQLAITREEHLRLLKTVSALATSDHSRFVKPSHLTLKQLSAPLAYKLLNLRIRLLLKLYLRHDLDSKEVRENIIQLKT